MIKVFLNNLSYRYDVYQIINLFYNLDDIDFVPSDADIEVFVQDKTVTVSNKDYNTEFLIHNNFTVKEGVKLAVYNFLKQITGKEFPWGTLVGIRPSKIASSKLLNDESEEEIIEYYKEHFNTRRDKIKLCIDVAKFESSIINKNERNISIYIGMPFCPTRCLYCSFTSNLISSNTSLVEPYLEALQKEIICIGNFVKENNLKVECVYFGGGTPTAVNDVQFDTMMRCINKNLIAGKEVREFTVECGRPDSITENKLYSMKNNGVQRISINPQTMNDNTLKKIGRNHTSKDVIEKYNLARKIGFDNINMDIIVGLNGENLESINNTCRQIYALNPDSVTIHGLSVKRASRLHEKIINKEITQELDHEEINKMYERTVKLASELNMKPYYMYRQKNMFGNMENVGYSKPFKEGIYNIQMIEEKQTIIAAGADGVSKVVFLDEDRIERFANVKDVKEYISRIDEMIDKKNELLNTLYNIR